MSVQSVYIALFGRPADPVGLAYWNGVTKNGADLSAMLAVLPGLPEYTSRFAGMDNTQIITTIYKNLFGREPDEGGLAYFKNQLESGAQSIATIAVHVLNGAQGSDLQDVAAKEHAANIFTASLDTPEEIAAYTGDVAAQGARAFLNNVDAERPATPESVQIAVDAIKEGDPNGGQDPVDPGPVDPDPVDPDPVDPGPSQPSVTVDADGVVSISAGSNVTVLSNGDNYVFAAAGRVSVTVAKDDVTGLNVAGRVNVDAALAKASSLDLSGDGTFNVTGVTFTPAVKTGVRHSLDAVPDIQGIIAAVDGSTDLTLSINGSEADTITALWDFWDAGYVKNFPDSYTDSEINSATIELGLRYLDYLGYPENDGGPPLTNIIAKGGDGREQTLHDNLLGNIGKASVTDRQLPPLVEAAFLARIPDPIESRKWISGEANDKGGLFHDLARAFDWNQGWDRNDWIDTAIKAKVDIAGIEGNNNLYFGGGNKADNFNIVRHEGAGIEIGLKAKMRGGADYTAELVDGVVTYDVPGGFGTANWGVPAVWSFDYSVISGLNGQTGDTLDNYEIVLSIDVDASDKQSWIEYTLNHDILPKAIWVSADGKFLGGDERSTDRVEQNSFNIGFADIQAAIDAFNNGYDFDGGEFDIKIAVMSDGAELVANTIRVDVGDLQ